MSATESISIHYQNRLQDHIYAGRVYYSRGIMAKIDKVVAGLLFAFGVWMTHTAGVQWWTVIWFVLAPLEWFDLLSLTPLRVYVAFRRNPKFAEPYDITFEESGIHFQTPSIDSRIAWSHFADVAESSRVFLLVSGKAMYSVIPKWAVGDAPRIDALRDMLKSHIMQNPALG